MSYFVQSAGGQERLNPVVRLLGRLVYWILPNFSAFDLKSQIIYGVALDSKGILLAQVYGIGYLGVLIVLAMIAFRRREFL